MKMSKLVLVKVGSLRKAKTRRRIGRLLAKGYMVRVR